MEALFDAMAEYLKGIGTTELKNLFDYGVIRRVNDLNGIRVTIDVTRSNVYMTANIDNKYYTVGCDGDELCMIYDETDHSSTLIEICKFEDFMLDFIPWYHAKLCPISTQQQVSKDVSKKSSLPFIGV